MGMIEKRRMACVAVAAIASIVLAGRALAPVRLHAVQAPAPVVVEEDNDFPWGLLGLLGLAGLMKRPRRIVETHTTVVPPRVDPPRMDPPRNDPPRPNPTNRV